MENGTQMTLEEYMPETFQKQIAGVLDSLASLKELTFLRNEDISRLNRLLLEIRSLHTKEDGKKSHQQCNETMPEFGALMDLESCQQEPRQSIHIMSLNQMLQWNLEKSNNSMVIGIPQWFCLTKNPMNTAKKCGGLSDAILLMGGELEEKTDRTAEELFLQSAMRKEQSLSKGLKKQNYTGLTQKNELVENIMCAITNYTNTLKNSGNTHMENGYREKHYVYQEKKQSTSTTDICLEMDEKTEKKQHPQVQHSFLVCALLHSDSESLFQLSTTLEEMKNALYKEENANKEILILSGYLKDQLRGIIVENMFVENCTSQKNLMILERCITSVLKKTNHMLQTEQSSTTAKTSQLQESNLDFKETVQACFSELCTLSDNSKKKIDPLTFSLRTLRICLVLMEDGISPDCSLKWSRGGYDAEWQVLNSKDFGVPQNRERCFIIGHLRGRSTSKIFPIEGTDGKNSVSLNLFGCLNGRNSQRDRVYSGDGLAPTISTKPGENTEPKVSILFDTSYIGQDGKARIYENICPTLTSRDYKEPRSVEVVCNVNPSEKRQNGRRFKEDGEPMFTLTGQDRHGIAIEVKEATKQGYAECRVGIDSVNFSMPNSKTRRGRVGQEIANTLDTSCNQGIFVRVSEELVVYAVWYEKYQCYIAIRKLTPKECFRLQGWTDDYFEKAEFVNSDSQLYKQAGNGVTVNVIKAIAENLENKEKN